MWTRSIWLWVVAVFFLTAAALQYNDTNAAVWATMFVVTGFLTATARLRTPAKAWKFATITASAACLIGAGWVATHEILNPGCMIGTDVPGPTLCGLWLGGLALAARFLSAPARPVNDPPAEAV